MDASLLINFAISACAFEITRRLIPSLSGMFIGANLFGNDLCKRDKPKIPEAMGVVTGCIFLIALFLFIPVPFVFSEKQINEFTQHQLVELISALLSICCMILLGFADDVLNLRWRHKLLLPTIASLPLLMVYYVNFNRTTIILPIFVRNVLGSSIDIGFLYYLYMGMLAVFCTNAINILAGINGLEAGQSLIIALSIIVFNFIEMFQDLSNRPEHEFSLHIMLPYFATSLALWMFNKYPARVFVGDTFCYLSGMTFAVVGILGHFSKTLLLFFIPQIINFLYSVPQLFHFVPCPRHRMPKYNEKTNLLEYSKTQFRYNDLNILGRLCVTVFRLLRIIEWNETNNDDGIITTNNFTLINFLLISLGPTHERQLTLYLLLIQVLCTCVAFVIRYPLAKYFYEY